MLHLASETSAERFPRFRHLDEALLDPALCEKKTASAAVEMLSSYPHFRFLQEPLAELTAQRIARADLDSRWRRIAEHEAEIIQSSCDRVRLHAG